MSAFRLVEMTFGEIGLKTFEIVIIAYCFFVYVCLSAQEKYMHGTLVIRLLLDLLKRWLERWFQGL